LTIAYAGFILHTGIANSVQVRVASMQRALILCFLSALCCAGSARADAFLLVRISRFEV
jgi:hypothetical protein